MKIKLLLAVCLFTGIGVSSADAQIVKHSKNQHVRIKQGVRSGELTKAEAIKLRSDQKQIRQEVKTAKSDGTITPDERKEIKKDQRIENRKIYRKKHNNRVRS